MHVKAFSIFIIFLVIPGLLGAPWPAAQSRTKTSPEESTRADVSASSDFMSHNKRALPGETPQSECREFMITDFAY